MFRNYLIIALRTLWRDKVHSTINVLGLGLGVLCCVLIAIYVRDEWTFDLFHSKVDRIYRVYVKEDWGEKQQFNNTVTPFPMGPALKENFSEVIAHVRINAIGAQAKVGEQVFNDQVSVAGQDFFNVFDFEFTSGNSESAFEKQDAVVLSEKLAVKYFGTANPLDKTIAIQLGDRFEDFSVKGVVSIPTNSSISFDILISDLNYPRLYSPQTLTSAWFNVIPETYVLLQEGTDPAKLQSKFSGVFKTLLGEEDFKNSKYFVGLQPMKAIHLDTTLPTGIAPVSDPKYSYILSGIALLILFVACINFVTLSVGRSLHRAKEVGVRKVVGAQRKQLIVQFLGESIVVTIVSIVAGLIGAGLCLPLFNDLAGKQLQFPLSIFLGGTVLVLLAVIGVITGSYPAFVLSSFRPITILKGALPKGKQGFRKALVGLQLVLSIFLISSTLVMRQQLQYLQEKNLGFNKDQLAVVQLAVPRARLAERVAKGFEIAEQFKTELSREAEIEAICGSSHDFGNGGWTNVGFTDDNDVYRTFNLNIIDDEYIPAMRMEMAAGRNFSDANPSDRRRSIIVNEALVREYGWKDAVGKRLPGKKFADHEIIGVVKDFNYSSLYTAVTPLVMVEDAAIALSGVENINIDNSPVPKLLVRIKGGMLTAGIARIEEAWKKINGSEEFSFAFVDQALNRQYRNDQNLGRMVSLATALSILIGSLGLYALASLAMQTRIKEISIRKVMGATVQSLLVLLSKEYLILVVLSLVFSVPLTMWMMNNWLETFEYRITIGWGIFLASGGVALGIALLAIGHQTLKTAAAEPAETLRCD